MKFLSNWGPAILAVGLACFAVVAWQWNAGICFTVAIFASILLSFGLDRFLLARKLRKRGAEIGDPFEAEVLLDGSVVALLADSAFSEMFWRSYRITPVSPEAEAIILNDALWEKCRFTFRHPPTGMICATGLAGSFGSSSHVQQGRIQLRGLYFNLPPPG